MATKAQTIAKLLENCKHYDKDYRHTGAHDLCNEVLNSVDQFEETMEQRICAAFISHLTDESIEVKSNAVRCIQRVTQKIRDSNLIIILRKLASEIVDGKTETIDIFSLCIKGIINESLDDRSSGKNQDERASGIISTLGPYLLKGIDTSKEDKVKVECLDISTELFKRFGLYILQKPDIINRDTLMRAINKQMTEGTSTNVRKRASFCMGAFAIILNGKQLQQLVQLLVAKISKGTDKREQVIYVQCLALMAKSVGTKLAPYLNDIVPMLYKLVVNQSDESNDIDNDLCEAALTTLQSIIRKCPGELKLNSINELFKKSMSLVEYDPNYQYADSDEEMQVDEDDAGWDDYGQDDQDHEQDDDDTSWKVRRGGYRVIDAIIETRPDLHVDLIKNYGLKMADRFKERVDEVKCALLDSFKTLIMIDYGTTVNEKSKQQELQRISYKVVANLIKQTKSKNLKVKILTLQCLATLSNTLYQEIDAYFGVILPVILDCIEDKYNYDPILDSLRILKNLFKYTPVGTKAYFHNSAPAIQNILLSALRHEYARVVGKSLGVTGSFLHTLVGTDGVMDSKFRSLVQPLFDEVYTKLNKVDMDLDVKQQSIVSSADVVSSCHTVLSSTDINNVVKIFVARLNHELTRDTALKGLTLVALNEASDSRGRSSVEKKPIYLEGLSDYLPAVMELLNKNQRQLQLNTLDCLEALTRRYSTQFQNSHEYIYNQIAPMMSDQDLQRATLAIRVSTNLLYKAANPMAHQAAVQAAVVASTSELIQGYNLDYLHEFFVAAAKKYAVDKASVAKLLDQVTIKSQHSALCLAIVVATDAQYAPMKADFIKMSSGVDVKQNISGLLCLGEYGKLTDLSKDNVLDLIYKSFDHPNEEVRQAASISLGKLTIGNAAFFLDKVLSLVKNSSAQKKYLFLNTIREIIIHNSVCLRGDIDYVQELLISQTTHEEESIRSIVAESVGRLFCAFPDKLIVSIDSGLRTGNALMKSTLAKSVKYSGQKAGAQGNELYFKKISTNLILMAKEADPGVKKNSLEGLTTIVHNNWQIVQDQLGELLNFAFAEVPIRKELIEEVDIGPFTQKYDKGIPIRRASFHLLQTLFEVGATTSDSVAGMVDAIVKHGLLDTSEEVVVLNLQLLYQISRKATAHVLSKMDELLPPLTKKLDSAYQSLKREQLQERGLNLVRHVLRVVYEIENSDEHRENPVPHFSEFVTSKVMANPSGQECLNKIRESSNAEL